VPTLAVLYRALAMALDDLLPALAGAGTSSTVTMPALVNPTAGASTTRYDGAFVCAVTGAVPGQQRRVRTAGYAPSTGTLTVYPAWNAPDVLDEVDITRLFPVITASANVSPAGDVDYRTLTNRALERYPVPDRLALTTVSGQYAYSLAAYGHWISSEDHVGRLLGPPILSGYPPAEETRWRFGRIAFDGGAPTLYLRAPYTTDGETFLLDVVRPASSLVNGAESTTGLSAFTDAVADQVRLEDFLVLGMDEAYRALANRGADGRPWAPLAEHQQARAEAKVTELAARARGIPASQPSERSGEAA
jgi:hypothetical protein